MDTIQTKVSDQAMITAIRANMSGFFHHASRSYPENYFEDESFIRWHTPIAHPWFNGVLCSRPPGVTDAAFVEACIQYFRAQNTNSFTWWMEPHVKSTDWEPILSSYGFGRSNDTPGMAIDLQTLGEPSHAVDSLEVREVTDEETLRTCASIFTTGYGLPAEWEPLVFDLEHRLGLDLPVRNYLGYWNNEPVAASALFIGGGAAGIYNVATIPEARGRGIGAAVTLRPLQVAREMGYRIGILQSSEMGFGVYQKLGFRHLCQIEYFYLSLD
jgi:ribosomal protein S18 acetylase RimI-like enzyme